MDENVAVGHADGLVVRVRDAYNTNRGLVARGLKGSAAEEENDVVEEEREVG